MTNQWTADSLLEMARAFQPACVLMAAAELDLFALLAPAPLTAEQVTAQLHTDLRGTAILLDALAALGLLAKHGSQYTTAQGIADLLTAAGRQSILAMVHHQANCLRPWSELARIVHTGAPAERRPSIRGAAADYAAFIEAMDNISRSVTDRLVADLPRLQFRRVLDVGGATGSWTIAFLRAYPNTSATLFDLPQVIPQARERLSAAGLLDRVTLAAGDFYADPLPTGCDLAWVSAIVHQNSRQQNRDLFARLHAALPSGGQVLIRDYLMEESRTAPASGALFAVNMLVATPAGGTFTVTELSEDLAAAGFRAARVLHPDEGMHAVLGAIRA